jgi:hypothetical protein
MERLKISLPEELRARIEAASSSAGHSLGEEIRQRLERSLNDDAIDPKTRELGTDVMWLASEINHQSGDQAPWHAHDRAHEALATALLTWLELIKPATSAAVRELFGPNDPQTLGRVTARHLQRLKATQSAAMQQIQEEMRKNDEQLRKPHAKGKRS